jgi:hypothetical protein
MTSVLSIVVCIASLFDAPAAIRASKLPGPLKGYLLVQFVKTGMKEKQLEFVIGKENAPKGFGLGPGSAAVLIYSEFSVAVHIGVWEDMVAGAKFLLPKLGNNK